MLTNDALHVGLAILMTASPLENINCLGNRNCPDPGFLLNLVSKNNPRPPEPNPTDSARDASLFLPRFLARKGEHARIAALHTILRKRVSHIPGRAVPLAYGEFHFARAGAERRKVENAHCALGSNQTAKATWLGPL